MNAIIYLFVVIVISVYMISLGTRGYKSYRLRAIGDIINTLLMLILTISQIRQENCLVAATCVVFMVLDLMCFWYNIENCIKLKEENKPDERKEFLKKLENYGSKRY